MRLIGFCRDESPASDAKLQPEPAESFGSTQPERVESPVQGMPPKSLHDRGVARLREADKLLRGSSVPDPGEWAELSAVAEEVPAESM